MEPRWQRALLLAGGTAAAAGLLWYLLREGDDEEEQDAAPAAFGVQDGSVLFFKNIDPNGCTIGIRKQPDVLSEKTGNSLFPGEVFQVVEVLEASGEQRYLRLADGRGWAFTHSSRDGRLLATEVSAEEAMNAPQAPGGMQAMMQEMHRLLEANPELREQVLSSPAVQGMMANPAGLRAAAEQSPAVAEALSQRPELREALTADPTALGGVLGAAAAEAAAGARATATAATADSG